MCKKQFQFIFSLFIFLLVMGILQQSSVTPLFGETSEEDSQSEGISTLKIVVMSDFSDQLQFDTENQIVEVLRKLQENKVLDNTGNLEMPPMVINTGQPGGDKWMKGWKIKTSELPLLAIIEVSADNETGNLIWKETVTDVPTSIEHLMRYLGVSGMLQGPVIKAVEMKPKKPKKPLKMGETVSIKIQGIPGGVASAQIGDLGEIALFEESPGVYKGSYTVDQSDNESAVISVTLTAPDGSRQTKQLGTLVMEGLVKPTVQSVQQVGPGEWLITGTAPPHSSVKVDIRATAAFIFKVTTTYSTSGVADASGRYQATFQTTDKIGGAKGNFMATATLNNGETLTSQELNMEIPQSMKYPDEPNPPSNYDVYSLAGIWWHGKHQCSIQVTGKKNIVTINEYGDRTAMTLQGGMLVADGWNSLTGFISYDYKKIEWNNGTKWTRSKPKKK